MVISKKIIKDLVSRVNQGLWYYEKDWVSVQRYPNAEKIKPQSLEEFVEMRFNYEASKVPELEDAVLKTEGRLFSCVELVDPDETKRKFSKATIKLLDLEDIPDEFEDLKVEISGIKEMIGGNKISFNSVKRKIRLTIYE